VLSRHAPSTNSDISPDSLHLVNIEAEEENASAKNLSSIMVGFEYSNVIYRSHNQGSPDGHIDVHLSVFPFGIRPDIPSFMYLCHN
jgi:hypothetical protein